MRSRYRGLFRVLLGLIAALPASHAATADRAPETITVAVAASMQPAFSELAEQFTASTGLPVQGSFGATGKLVGQILNGAPFHLLLAADMDYPQQLHAAKMSLQPPRPYAVGSLVIWTTRDLPLDDWPTLLQSHNIKHIAIADPGTAPYGREAARALQHHRLLRVLTPKLVYGESIGQTNQFIVTGSADIGFTARASVTSNPTIGHWREVAPESYSPIIHAAVLLKHAASHEQQTAARFYEFLFSPAASAILQRHGYRAVSL
jgi:molybdate transport system substrate-binding protein